MNSFLPLLSLLLCLPALRAEPLNHKDPAAVAKHYAEACQNMDADAAAEVVSELEASALETKVDTVSGFMKEILCLPLLENTAYALGDLTTTGDETRVSMTVTYTIPATLVLKKIPDGTWQVALEKTILQTTGAETSEVMRLSKTAYDGNLCSDNVEKIGEAILEYAEQHDGILPSARTWMDQIKSYLENEQVLKCPAARDLRYGYAFNEKLSKVRLDSILDDEHTPLVFESSLGARNACAKASSASQMARHNKGGFVVYVNGDTGWLEAE
ncbi:MAG: hypothetical protein ABFE08_06350 [Armatimonadia bacterium]